MSTLLQPKSLPPRAGGGQEGGAPVLEGWFTLNEREPHLIGSRCLACGTYYFPKVSGFCRNPDCAGDKFEDVPLSRTGTLWSYTNACYQPPEPFVAAQPYVPFSIAAVELEKERMIVLGPVVDGVAVDALKVGQKMELVLEPLADGKLVWKWKPQSEPAADGRPDLPSPSGRRWPEGPDEGGAAR